jgi:hypothetical protein
MLPAARDRGSYLGEGAQQPVMQYSPGAHAESPGWPQLLTLAGQRAWLVEHSGNGFGLPTHTSQASHGFSVAVTGVHGRHAAGSASVASVQLPALCWVEPIHT